MALTPRGASAALILTVERQPAGDYLVTDHGPIGSWGQGATLAGALTDYARRVEARYQRLRAQPPGRPVGGWRPLALAALTALLAPPEGR